VSERRRMRFVAPLRSRTPDHELAGEIAFLPMESIGDDGTFDRAQTRLSDEISGRGYTYFRDGDVVRARVTPCFENGKGALLTNLVSGEGLGTTELFVFTPGLDVDPRFLFYVTQSDDFRQQGEATIYGAHGVKRVDDVFARDYRVWLPPLDEQRAIADYLHRETARIAALIAAKERTIALLNERWVAERSAAILPGYDPVAGSGVVPDAWDSLNLGVAIELHRGHDLPSEARRRGAVPVVSSGGISGWHDQAACQPPGVVTGRYGTIGTTYYLDEPYWPLNTTLYVSNFRGAWPRWVFHMLAALPLSIDEEKSAVTGINRNVVGALRVLVPPVTEQRIIARQLDEAAGYNATVRDSIGAQLNLLRERRQAVITAAVTGQIEVGVAT
jgi:type I restriction enzyme, S subunit